MGEKMQSILDQVGNGLTYAIYILIQLSARLYLWRIKFPNTLQNEQCKMNIVNLDSHSSEEDMETL